MKRRIRIEERRIVHVIGSLTAGGAERFVADLLPEIKRRGNEVALIALSGRRDALGDRMHDALRSEGIRVLNGPTRRIRFRSVVWYGHTLRRLRPDLIHLHLLNTEAAHYLVHRFLRHPYVGVRTIHSTQPHVSALAGRGLERNPISATIFCSEASRSRTERLMEGFKATIPNGIRFDWPIRTRQSSLEYKRRLGLEPERTHFLCVGSFLGTSLETSPKAHDTIVHAWKRGEAGRRGAILHLLGDGNLRPQMESLVGADPTIRLHGVRPDVCDWMIAADCFLMPSRWEGLPIAALEAIGTGIPCIFSSIPPLEDLQPPCAIWCAASDVDSLAGAIRNFIENPTFPDEPAIEAERKRHAVANTAEAYLAIYDRFSDED